MQATICKGLFQALTIPSQDNRNPSSQDPGATVPGRLMIMLDNQDSEPGHPSNFVCLSGLVFASGAVCQPGDVMLQLQSALMVFIPLQTTYPRR